MSKTLLIPWRLIRLVTHLLRGFYLLAFAEKVTLADHQRVPHPQVVSDWMLGLLKMMNIELQVTGDRPHTKALLVANHISWLDIPVIAAASHANFLAKYEISRWPVIGWMSRSTGTLFIRRGKGEAQQIAEAIMQRLDGDRQLALFPEGTTSEGTGVRPFFARLFSAAIDTNTPVVPVTLYYSVDGLQDSQAPYVGNQSFMSNLLQLLGRPGSRVDISFHPAIDPQGMDRKTLAEASRQAIDSGLQQLRAG